MAFKPITSWQIGEKMETVTDFIFLGSDITTDSDGSREIKTPVVPWKESCDKPKQQRWNFTNKGSSSENYDFSISHVQMLVLNHKEG